MKRINWVLAMCVVFSQGSVWATVIRVPADQATIQAGINIAFPGDTVLVADGTYSENLTIGKAITLLSENGSAGCVVNGNNSGRVILVDSVAGCRIIGLTIKKGYLSSANFPDGFGAGILVLNSTVDIINCNIYSNYAQGGAGGIAMLDGSYFTIKDSRIFGNQTPAATGGVLAGNSTGEIEKSLIAYNQAQHCGGVFLYSDNFTSFVDLVNNTICNNVSQVQGSGIECRRTTSDIRNNIVAYNHGAYGIWSSLSTVTFEYNDLWSNEVGNDTGVALGVGNIEQDPLFADTSSLDYSLYACSPCIDSGDTATVYNDPDGTRNDIGAIFHDKSAPRVIRVPLECPTIKKGIYVAQYGDTVLVGPGTYYENDTLRAGIALISEKGADSTIIDGDSATPYPLPVLRCDSCENLVISGFTIRNGECSVYPQLWRYNAGGINCNNCDNLVLESNKIIANFCPYTCFLGGVGAYVTGDSVLIKNNLFSDNQLINGDCSGTIGGAGLHINGDYCQIESNTFHNNRSEGGNGGKPGGAIVSKGSQAIVRGNLFTNNLSNSCYTTCGGGALHLDSKNSIVDSNVFEGNIALGGAYVRGGALYVTADSCVIRGNMFSENSAQGVSCFPSYGGGSPAGGAIYSAGTDNQIVNNTIVGNRLSSKDNPALGAGISSAGKSNLIANNVIAYNTIDADYGGRAKGAGVYISGDSTEVLNNSFYRNQALGRAFGFYQTMYAQGGGIFCSAVDANITNNIFAQNRADIYCNDTSKCLSGNDCVDGSLCVPDSVGGGAITCSTSVVLDCNDFYENYANGILNHINGTSYGLNDFSADPLFCLPESLDFHLLENSPCLNALNCGLVGAMSLGCTACIAKPGDANASNSLSLADVISAVNYIFNKTGCSVTPDCWLSNILCRGDWNGSLSVTLADVIHGVNYIFSKPGGPWNPVPSGVCCLPVP